ncbi:MAG TPA: adenylyl-sulfate kinase [Polyangia bacterium]
MSRGVVVWLTGLPRSGKSMLADAVRAALVARGRTPVVLDGDAVRVALVPPPGYDPEGRDAFYATLGNLAALLAHQGHVVVVPATAHKRAYRDAARAQAPAFIEVHVASSLAECKEHDRAGLYSSAARAALPGVGIAYEAPAAPEVIASGGEDRRALDAVVARIEEVCHGIA